MEKNSKEKSLLPINLLRDLNLDDDDSLSESSDEEDNQNPKEPVFDFDSNNQNKINFEQPKKEKKQNQRSSVLPVDIEKINVQKIINPIPKYVSKRTSAPTLPNEELENLYKEIYQRKIYKNSATNVINENNKNNQFKIFLLNNKNSILPLINSYSGSHFLQNMIDFITLEDIDILLDIINNNLPEIMCNSYGNYFLQKIIEKTNSTQRINLLNNIKEDFIFISKDISGSHCIQTLIEKMDSDEEEEIIKSLVENVLFDLTISQNSTQVILKLVNNINNPKRYYLIQFCMNNFISLSVNLNGSTIIKKFISQVKNYQLIQMITIIIEQNYIQIVENQFGNYVIQDAFQYFGFNNCKGIIKNIINDSIYFSLQKYASNVIDKVVIILRTNDNILFYQLVENLFFNSINFNKLIENKFGTFVLCNLLKLLNPAEKLYIRSIIVNMNYGSFLNKSNLYINANLGKFLCLLN